MARAAKYSDIERKKLHWAPIFSRLLIVQLIDWLRSFKLGKVNTSFHGEIYFRAVGLLRCSRARGNKAYNAGVLEPTSRKWINSTHLYIVVTIVKSNLATKVVMKGSQCQRWFRFALFCEVSFATMFYLTRHQ